MVLVLIPLQVMAFELEFDGRKDLWTNYQHYLFEDKNGVVQQQTDWSFGHSLEFNFHGNSDDGYIMGYITDDLEKMDAVYLDAALGDYKLQWANYQQAFLLPTWFNLRQEFRGARLNYLGFQDRLSLLGVRGENYLREESRLLYPGDEAYYHSLAYENIVDTSVRVWLNGKELQYGADFMVWSGGILSFKVPIKETSHLYIRYLEEGMGYLVYGGRYERYFQLNETQSLAGSLVYLHNRDLFGQNLIGTEWLYQVAPWWTMELNLGGVQQQSDVYQSEEQNESKWDLNWRLGQQVHWNGLELALDYQMIRNNFQNLLYGGKIGEILNLFGAYQKDDLMLSFSQYYKWSLDHQLDEKEGVIEFHWANPHWAHFYFSQYQKGPSKLQNGFAELGYLTENDWGFLTYILGVDMQNSGSVESFLDGALPYLKLYYEKLENQNLEGKLYGHSTEEGLELTRLQLSGTWDQGSMKWQGEMMIEPDYYRTNHKLEWVDLPANVSVNLIQNRYFVEDWDYLNLDLQVDLTALLEADTRLNLSLIQDEMKDEVKRTYSLGGEWSFKPEFTGYGEMSISDDEGRNYSGGLRGNLGAYGWDVNYVWSLQPREDLTDLIQHSLTISVGSEDDLMVSGRYMLDSELYSEKELKVGYFILPEINVNASYLSKDSKYSDLESEISPWSYHQLNFGTAYHF